MITDAKALAEKAAALKKLAAARKQREEVRKAEPAKAPAKK
jgi:hypothetical protein